MGLLNRGKSVVRQIPKPTGPFVVGCTDVMVLSSPDGVFVRLFYPAVHTKDSKSPEWLPHQRYLKGYAKYFKIWKPIFCKSFPKFVGDIKTPAAWDAPPLRVSGKRYPVLVFSHGLGGCRTTYTTFCLELASQGFVVAALEHRDQSACMTFFYESSTTHEDEPEVKWIPFKKVRPGKHEYDIRNKQVHQRARECSAALNLLEALDSGEPIKNILVTSSLDLTLFQDILDLQRAAIAGHSFGGATTLASIVKDKRFKAGVGLDTWMLPLKKEDVLLKDVQMPILFVNMEKFQTRDNLIVMKKVEDVNNNRIVLTLKGTVHLNQCDVPFLCDKPMRILFGAHSSLDRSIAMGLTTALTSSFLAKHLEIASQNRHKEYINHHQNVIIEGIK